jgi:hypothetical protein
MTEKDASRRYIQTKGSRRKQDIHTQVLSLEVLRAVDIHDLVGGCGIGRVVGIGDLDLAPLAVGGDL